MLGDVHLREAEPADADVVAAIHVRAWQEGYRGLLPHDELQSLRPADRASRYTFGSADPRDPATLVAVDGDAILGFVTVAGPPDDHGGTVGEVCALYVDPSWWGHGVGRALIRAARSGLTLQGFTTAVLWMLVGNDRADRFYRSDGWEPDGALRTKEAWGFTVHEIRYGRLL